MVKFLFAPLRSRMGLLSLLALCAAQPAAAQNPDSLRNVLAGLKQRLSRTSDPVDALTHIGAIYLKLEHPDSAALSFRQALQQDSARVGAHVGLGRVLLDFQNRPKDALEHFQYAVKTDSASAQAHYDLARAYQRLGQTTSANRSADRAIRLNPKFAPPYLLLARNYQEQDNTQAALIYYKTYLEQNPEDENSAYEFALYLLDQEQFKEMETLASRMGDARGLPLLAQAQIRRRDHESAQETFRRYIITLPEEEQSLYEDISLVGLPREVRAYQSTPPDARENFLRDFWLRKDPFKTSGGAMRRAEHYRRVWHARTFFGKKWPWDRRGETYIRYGKPDYRSSSRDLNARVPLDVQRVQEMMAHQLYGPEAIDQSFVGPVFPIRTSRQIGMAGQDDRTGPNDGVGLPGWRPITTSSDWSSVSWEVWIYTDIGNGLEMAFTDEFHSGNYDYAPIPSINPQDLETLENQGVSPLTLIQRLSEYAPATRMASLKSEQPERYSLSELEPLEFYYEWVTFRGPGGRTDMQINIGIPIDHVARGTDSDTSVIVERRIALVDSRRSHVEKKKQVLSVPVSYRYRNQGMLAIDRISAAVAPGDYELAVEAWQQNTDRTGVYREAVSLPDYGGENLLLSDLFIAQRITEATGTDSAMVRGKWKIQPWPPASYRSGDPLYVYFEIYNLTRDEFGQTRYQISYEVRAQDAGGAILPFLGRLRSKDGEAIGLSYEQLGTETTIADYVELDLSQAKPARYTLQMNIKDLNSGQTISKDREFRILDPPR